MIQHGRYIKWHQGHFVAALVGDTVVVIDGKKQAIFSSPDEAGRGHEHVWYRLVSCERTRDLDPALQSQVDTNWARAMRKRTLPVELPCAASASLSSAQQERLERNREEALRRRGSMLIRPHAPVGWEHPIMPQTPAHNAPWIIDLPEVNLLRYMNAHPRDRHIRFLSGPHLYFVKGKQTLGSVTGLVHSLAQPFDAPAVIEKMTKGANWPRPGYLRTSLRQTDLAALQEIPEASVLLSLVRASNRDEQAICQAARHFAAQHEKADAIIAAICMSPQEIIHKWNCNRDEAARAGTWMHFTFEAILFP